MNKILFFLLATGVTTLGFAQDSIPVSDVQTQKLESIADASLEMRKDSTPNFKRVKLDGISAVIGDYVILESDIQKTLIDLRNQGASEEEVTECGLLGKLMEDRMYAHQAVQDSILVSDDEVYLTGDRQLQGLVQQIGSMEKVLEYYRKENEADFRDELYKINKLRMLSDRMKESIVSEIEITPEEVRQFFNKIPESERPVFGAEMEISQIVKEPKPTEAEKQKIIDRLNTIKADIEDNGASFNVKAILYSKDPGSKANGGFIGSVTKESGYVKEFKDTAFSLKEGEISEPFETSFGYHIMLLEKIRGQELDVRHILLQPEVSQASLDEAKKELDSIRKHIMEGKFTFEEAALNFSDQKETKFEGGKLRNPQDFSSRFELTNMDPALYNQVRNLKDEISYPILEPDLRGGPPKYKIMKVSNRYDEHVADYSQDYIKIKDLATKEKQLNAIKKWMNEHIENTYITISEEKKDCVFANNWVKE